MFDQLEYNWPESSNELGFENPTPNGLNYNQQHLFGNESTLRWDDESKMAEKLFIDPIKIHNTNETEIE